MTKYYCDLCGTPTINNNKILRLYGIIETN